MNKILRAFDLSLFNRSISLNQNLNSDKSYSSILENIEDIFNDSLGSGFSDALNTFFNSINDMLIRPDDLAARSQFIANAKTLVGKIRNSNKALEDLKQLTVLKIRDQINEINQITNQIAKLNNLIKTKALDVDSNNEYLNERDRLIKRLSDLIDVKIVINDNNTVNVFTAKGFGLVVDISNTELQFETDADGNAIVKWNNTNDITNDIQNGEVGGNLKGLNFINNQLNKLNDFTTVFAEVFNKVHRQGYGLDGINNRDFFSIDPNSSLTKIDASNIIVAVNDPKQVAIAINSTYLNSDNTNGKNLLKLKDSINGILTSSEETTLKSKLFDSDNYDKIKGSKFSEFYNTNLVALLSSESSKIKTQMKNNQFLYDAISEKMKSLTGVNMDEELINLTKLQRSYQAAAKIITVTDELMQTILNIGK